MADINVHTRMHIIDNNGNNITLYPTNTASDVTINKTVNGTTYTDLNSLVNALTSNAFSSDTYLTTSDASSTYLTKTDASSTYLTKTDASSTYTRQADTKKYAFGSIHTNIAKDTDLNTIVTPGIYYTEVTSGQNTTYNMPEGVNGLLIVINYRNANVFKQIWIRYGTPGSNDGSLWFRQSSNSGSTWGKWWRHVPIEGIQNNLTYSTSNTTQALSAYQGYVLNTKLGDQVTYSLSGTTLTITTKTT